MRIVGAVLILLLAALPATAQELSLAGTAPVRVAEAKAKKRTPAPPPSRESSAVPIAERIAIQFDLAWTGDYNGLINGEFTEKTIAAIKQFQRNRKFRETGVLNPQERALLAAAAKSKQTQAGWTIVDDPVTGARLGIPTKHVPTKSATKTGTRWSSAQGQIQVETFRIREPGTTLAVVFEQQKKEPPTRKLEVNLLRGDFFILSGMQGLKRFYVRAEIKDGEVRGMTVLYDQATDTIMDPVVVAMSGTFAPFPSVTIARIGPLPKRKVEYGTGIVVSALGHILTDRQLTDECEVVVVSGYGDADRLAADKTAELALIRVHGEAELVPAALVDDTARGPDLTLVGIADPQSQGGGSAVSTVAARLKGELIEPAPQLGFSGAAVLDAQGRFLGMAELKAPAAPGPGGTQAQAQAQATVVPLQTIRAFLDGQRLAAASGRAGVEAAKASVVRVICVRK
jgi:peptidoglycan hydrolase-like protein with peptidoglycan-binding domain